ncbi:hypothetical protein Q3G72_011950 [Acer saccharum]|nr:hypothetical protein Q3G72_011950 [Acer saccharum]
MIPARNKPSMVGWNGNDGEVGSSGLTLGQRCLMAFSIGKKYKKIADNHRHYSEFQEGDLVWTNLRIEWFMRGKYDQLHDRGGGPYKIYHGENEVVGLDSRASPFQPRESDA